MRIKIGWALRYKTLRKYIYFASDLDGNEQMESTTQTSTHIWLEFELGCVSNFFCFIYSHVYIRSYKFVSHLPFFSLSLRPFTPNPPFSHPSLIYRINEIRFCKRDSQIVMKKKKIRLAFLNTRNSHDIVSGQKENQQPYLSLYV